MHVGATYYPEAAVASRAHGICKVHVAVSEAGVNSSVVPPIWCWIGACRLR